MPVAEEWSIAPGGIPSHIGESKDLLLFVSNCRGKLGDSQLKGGLIRLVWEKKLYQAE